MESSTFHTEGKKHNVGVDMDVEVIKLKRQQKHLLTAVAALLLLSLFCVAMVIWLSVEVTEDNDDDGGTVRVNDGKSEVPATDRASTLNEDARVVTLTSRPDSSSEARPLLVGTGYWTEKASLPYGRSDHHAVAVDDFIYIIGGQNTTAVVVDDVQTTTEAVLDDVTIYDTIMDTYASGPSLPSPLHRFGSAYDTDRQQIYVFGGMNVSDGHALDAVYVLDIESQKWTEGPKLPFPRSDLCGAYVDGHVYAIGGYSLDYEETLDTTEALDIASGEWKEVASMPTHRGDCKAAPFGRGVIVVGGYYDPTGAWNHEAFRDEVEFYSPGDDVWEERAPLKNARGDKAIVVLPRERLLVVGGETHNRGLRTGVATHHVEEYSMSEDVWIDRAPLLSATFRTTCAYADGVVYVFGGDVTCASDDADDHSECEKSDTLQVYFDTEQPNVFIT